MLKYYIQSNQHDVVFYRNSYRRFIYIALMFLVINFALVGLIYNQLLSIKVPPNFATTTDGRIIELKTS